MNRPFDVQLPLEQSYLRRGLFALELLDPVTLFRVSQGVEVVADGLRGKSSVNSGGLFVWLQEDIGRLRSVSINPRTLPYERVTLRLDQLRLPPLPRPITTIELSPRLNYPFAAGITGFRGMLIEERVSLPGRPTPVPHAEVRLRWLDEDGVTWREAPTISRTDEKGSFAAILRLTPADVPQLDANGAFTVRARVWRSAAPPRDSVELKLPQGRIADPSTFAQGREALILAWDELQP
jgi:hypothetical protein